MNWDFFIRLGRLIRSPDRMVDLAIRLADTGFASLMGGIQTSYALLRMRSKGFGGDGIGLVAAARVYRRASAMESRFAPSQAFRDFLREFRLFNQYARMAGRPVAEVGDLYPCLHDRTKAVGFEGHYVYHTAWAARILAETQPRDHKDIGSFLMFNTMCSAFLPIEHYDYRRVETDLDGLTTGTADLTQLSWQDGSIASLSCMHVVEHIGLGRYGDPVDPDGDRRAMAELQRVLAPGGQLLFVVPVGKPKIQFNAHRIYSYDQVLNGFPLLKLIEFSLISMKGRPRLLRNASPDLVPLENWGCGCFLFRKPNTSLAQGKIDALR